MNTLAEMEHISLNYGRKEILKDITWKIVENEHWAVFGLNGSGKTTLLNILTGYQSQSSGKIKFAGYSYHKDNILDLRREIGYVSSSFWDKYYCNEAILDIVLGGLSGAFGRTAAIQDQMVIAAKKSLISLVYITVIIGLILIFPKESDKRFYWQELFCKLPSY